MSLFRRMLLMGRGSVIPPIETSPGKWIWGFSDRWKPDNEQYFSDNYGDGFWKRWKVTKFPVMDSFFETRLVAVSPSGSNIYVFGDYRNNPYLLVSHDEGKNWALSPVNGISYFNGNAAVADDNGKVLVSANDYKSICVSTDDGKNFVSTDMSGDLYFKNGSNLDCMFKSSYDFFLYSWDKNTYDRYESVDHMALSADRRIKCVKKRYGGIEIWVDGVLSDIHPAVETKTEGVMWISNDDTLLYSIEDNIRWGSRDGEVIKAFDISTGALVKSIELKDSRDSNILFKHSFIITPDEQYVFFSGVNSSIEKQVYRNTTKGDFTQFTAIGYNIWPFRGQGAYGIS